ncbi:hypothetical protein AGLY_006255 [Aphis glycines]|uniref:Uncharacterized protein n=1 Tax=Aphis glycines TaxID=307491 RepID=A0A6G0TR37_APHGL|nr:hypothetical protein AGLY_006255 [Aphis glycines]
MYDFTLFMQDNFAVENNLWNSHTPHHFQNYTINALCSNFSWIYVTLTMHMLYLISKYLLLEDRELKIKIILNQTLLYLIRPECDSKLYTYTLCHALKDKRNKHHKCLNCRRYVKSKRTREMSFTIRMNETYIIKLDKWIIVFLVVSTFKKIEQKQIIIILPGNLDPQFPFNRCSIFITTLKTYIAEPLQSKVFYILDSERIDECIDFTMIITSRNIASISNFGGGFRWQSEYPWYIIEINSKHFPTVLKKIEKNKKKNDRKQEFLRKTMSIKMLDDQTILKISNLYEICRNHEKLQHTLHMYTEKCSSDHEDDGFEIRSKPRNFDINTSGQEMEEFFAKQTKQQKNIHIKEKLQTTDKSKEI